MVGPVLLPYILSLILSIAVALYAWRRRQVNGSLAFLFVAICQAVWTFFFILELTSDLLALKILYDKIQWVAGFGWVVSFFAFSYNYLGIQPNKIAWGVVAFFFVGASLMVISDDLHSLLYPNPHLLPEEPFSVLDYDFTWLTFVLAAFMYAIYLSGYGPLLRQYFQSPGIYRAQILIILIGAILPLIAASIALADITLGYYRDTAPLSSGISNLIIAIGIFRYSLLDIVPIARDLVFENMHDAVIVVNKHNQIVDMNQPALRDINRSHNAVIGKPIFDLYPDHQPILLEIDNAMEFEGEMVFERDQQKEYRLVSISPIRDRKGTFIGRLIILRDINYQKQAQLELEQYTEEVKLLSTEYQSFAYSVSHDLQAPVRAVAGFSGLLIDNLNEQLDEENLDLLLRIRAASKRMENMISALLTLSRVSRNPLRLEEVNIKNLAEDLLEELEKTQPEHHVQTSIQADFSVLADPDLIRLLIQNLLSNAWKYTTLVPDPHIRLTASRREGESMICIEDNGIGFPMDRADKLFEPFQRLVDEESYPGLGIGLATARKIVQRHGGEIWAESEPGEGARFYFTLPEDR